jgi:hypothetical protein
VGAWAKEGAELLEYEKRNKKPETDMKENTEKLRHTEGPAGIEPKPFRPESLCICVLSDPIGF